MRRAEPLSDGELVELEALDRILAGEAVDDAELELAAIVASVRADAPRLDGDGAARIDARLEQARRRGARGARRPSSRRRWRWVGASAAGLAVAAAGIAFTLGVVQGGGPTRTTPDVVVDRAAPGPAQSSAAAGANVPPAPSLAAVSPSAGQTQSAVAGLPLGDGRLQQRAAALMLATSAGRFGAVANEIIVASEQLGGIVSSSNVDQQGSASLATFQLSVPSGNVSDVIATLSHLAQVQSLSQSSQDITNSYDGATSRLAASRRERDALVAALARATTLSEATSLRHRIAALDATIAARQGTVARLHGEAADATVQVSLDVATPAPASRHTAGTVARGWHDARDVLEVSLAIALVALAVIVPLTIVGLALWSAARITVRRGRERALERA